MDDSGTRAPEMASDTRAELAILENANTNILVWESTLLGCIGCNHCTTKLFLLHNTKNLLSEKVTDLTLDTRLQKLVAARQDSVVRPESSAKLKGHVPSFRFWVFDYNTRKLILC
jgi:hypothetical protein